MRLASANACIVRPQLCGVLARFAHRSKSGTGFGSNTGFLFLGAVALAAFGILYFFMPETRDRRSLSATNPIL
jgi:hypothetical protein